MSILNREHCPYEDYLSIVCVTLAVPQIAQIKRRNLKIRYTFYHGVDLTTFYLTIKKTSAFLCPIDKGNAQRYTKLQEN